MKLDYNNEKHIIMGKVQAPVTFTEKLSNWSKFT